MCLHMFILVLSEVLYRIYIKYVYNDKTCLKQKQQTNQKQLKIYNNL